MGIEQDVVNEFDKVKTDVEDVFHTGEADVKTDADLAVADVEAEAPVVEKDVEKDAGEVAADVAAEVPVVISDPGNVLVDADKVLGEVEAQTKPEVTQVEVTVEADVKTEEELAKEQAAAAAKEFAAYHAQTGVTDTPENWANRVPAPAVSDLPVHIV